MNIKITRAGEIVCGVGELIPSIINYSVWLLKSLDGVVEPPKGGYFMVLNGVKVYIAADSDPDLLIRDQKRAMNGYIKGPVGPYPKAVLSEEEVASDEEKHAEMMRQAEKRAAARRREKERSSRSLEKTLRECPEMEFSDKEAWDRSKESNQDSYGGAVLDFAERWARLMQRNMANGWALEDCASACSDMADVDGISGFMYGCAVGLLSKTWVHGEALRRWHNRRTQVGNEGDKANESGGVLNPALLCVGK